MRLVTDVTNPGLSGAFTDLSNLWLDEAKNRYKATAVFEGSRPLEGDDWAAVCTPDRLNYWLGLAPIIYVVPDNYERVEPIVEPHVWALRRVSGGTAGQCREVIEKYGSLRAIPVKAKKWYPHAQAAWELLQENFPHPELVEKIAPKTYVKMGQAKADYSLCEDLPTLLSRCEAAGRFAYDFEFGAANDEDDEEEKDTSLTPVGVSLSWQQGCAQYVPMGHEGYDRNYNVDKVMWALKVLSTKSKATLWNAKADMQIHMAHDGAPALNESARWFFEYQPDDAMAVSYLLSLEPLGLKARSWIDFHVRMQNIRELIGAGKKQIPFSQVPVEKAVPYGCQDSDMTLRHWNSKWPDLYDKGRDIYEQIERPLTVVLAHAQLRGMPFDREALTDLWTEDVMEMEALDQMIFAVAGTEWNLAANEQTACVLYTHLGLPPQKPTKTFKPSVGADALYPIAKLHPVIPLLLRRSKLSKLQSAFYVKLLSSPSDYIHCRQNQFVADTGRLTASEPNMQQNPPKVRKVFTGAPGLMAADESQLELRVMAKVSNDENMMAAFMADPPIDLHNQLMELTGITDRRVAKVGNFLTQYVGSPTALQLALWKNGIYWTLGQCSEFLNRLLASRPGVVNFFAEAVLLAEERGYAETVEGRRRYVPEIHSKKPDERGHAERQVINHPVQGTGSDKVKRAMVDAFLDVLRERCWMPLQIHDEILVLGEFDALERLRPVIDRALTYPNTIAPVPLVADIKIASNWGAAH